MSYDAKRYWNTLLENSLDEAGVCWPKWPHSYNRYLHIQQRDGLLSIFKKHSIVLNGSSVCEIGPGSGFWTKFFYESGVARYKGFDIARISVDSLSRKYREFDFLECDFSEYSPLQSEIGAFDLVVSVLVFLHITDNTKFEACIDNVGRMLKRGGYFVVLDAVSKNKLRGKQIKMGDGPEFNDNYHNKVRYLDYYKSVTSKNKMELVAFYPAFNITQNSFDFDSTLGFRIANWYFNKILNPVLEHSSERLGSFLGFILVGIDKLLFSNVSLSSKWLVFRKY